MSTHSAERALEDRPSVDDSTGADRSADIVLGAAVVAMGLLAGLYFFSAIAVMPALTAADDRTLIDAMQQMIDKIENPAFFLDPLDDPLDARGPQLRGRLLLPALEHDGGHPEQERQQDDYGERHAAIVGLI